MIGIGWTVRGGRRRAIARLDLTAEIGTRGEVAEGLRDWLYVCHAGALAAFMTLPSAAVAADWRELAAAPGYEALCHRAFGGEVLRPLPVARVDAARRAEGVRRTWNVLCAKERIDPRRPGRVPRLFALDEAVGHEPAIRWELCDGDPPYRLAGDTEPEVVCAWPESPFSEFLARPFGAGMYGPAGSS